MVSRQNGTKPEERTDPGDSPIVIVNMLWPANQRLERTGGQLSYLMRVPVAAGRSTAGRSGA